MMASKAKTAVIRVGDLVKVIGPAPRPVIRVGYPKTPKDYLPEAEAASGSDVDKLLAPYYRYANDPRMRWLRNKILSDMAYVLAGRDGLGGNERQIFFRDPQLSLTGKIAEVTRVRIAKTGTYYSPSSYSCPYSGEYDYDCGGLTNEKTHKLLELDFDSPAVRKLDRKTRVWGLSIADFYSPIVLLSSEVEKLVGSR